MRHLVCGVVMVSLAACSSMPQKITHAKPQQPSTSNRTEQVQSNPSPNASPDAGRAEAHNAQLCRPTVVHDERNYTAGGLYAPDITDTAPVGDLDISALIEPTPRIEEKSKAGNRSPYTVLNKKYVVLDDAKDYKARGIASWYGTKFNGRTTSNKEIYDMCQFTAAHKTLPIPSYARVTRLDTGQSVIVRINDRGPFHEGRIIDLSYAAAVKLGVNKTGIAKVEVEALTGSEMDSALSITPDREAENVSYLQVASFANKHAAEQLYDQLSQAHIEAVRVQKSKQPEQTVWRVRIGPLVGAEIAQIQAKLQKIGLKSIRVADD